MQRVLWFFVIALLAVNIMLLAQREQMKERLRLLQRMSAVATLKTEYAAEEEALLTETAAVPSAFPRPSVVGAAGVDAVQLVLLASVDDCTNCIEDEVAKLNQILTQSPERIAGVQGYLVDEHRAERAKALIAHLSPAPLFSITIRNALAWLPNASTPLVLVIRVRDGRILDAHKPIPEDLSKRDAFYARWSAALDRG